MTDIKILRKAVREALIEERVRKFKGLDNIHIVEQDEPTKAARQRTPRKPTASDELMGMLDDEPESTEEPTKSSSYVQGKELTPMGKGALKMNTVWSNNLTQIMNFNKGQQLAQLIAQRLQSQTDLPAQQMLPIISAVMKATLEQLDDEVSEQVQKEMPGLLDSVRG
jgi:hypothetical protein